MCSALVSVDGFSNEVYSCVVHSGKYSKCR